MAAEDGKQDREGQPERDVNACENQVGKEPAGLLCAWRDSRCQEPDGADNKPHGKYHDENNCGAGQEFAVDDGVPVDGLRDEPV